MTSARDIAWQQIETDYRACVTHQIARMATSWRYEQLPEPVLHMAKRCLLDTIGVAIGGHYAPGRAITENVVKGLGGAPEATIIGSGHKSSTIHAAMVNAFMVRYLDYNDLGGGGHNSDAIGALLAVAEAEKRNGKDLLSALVLSYELGSRWMNSAMTGDLMEDYMRLSNRGWCMDIRGGLNMPPSLGLLMGMNEEQIASAIGATIVRSFPSNHLDANDEEFVMAKNLRFGHVACDAILSCRLAREGFTGPRRAYEGEYGYAIITADGVVNGAALTADPDTYYILETSFKPLCANYTTQAGIQSTLALCEEHDIKPDDVASVKIICCEREAKHTTYIAKKYPRNGESADHSLYYANAHAIIYRDFGPKAFKAEKFTDPAILDLIERIDYEINNDAGGFSNAGGSEITLKDGTVYKHMMEEPLGHHTNPLSDKQLEEKFREMALEYYSEQQTQDLIDTIWNFENVEQVSDFMQKLVFPS